VSAAGDTREVRLPGGITNAGLVARVGDTVRRPTHAATPAVHALLAHLERVGFDGAPRVLGTDERGREVLSYVPGRAVLAAEERWWQGDDALASVAGLLRRYHDAAASFDPAPHRWARPVPAAFRDGLVTHNDPNLDNVVFRGGRAVALIDFDLAAPGSAVWDVACAARLWAPLGEERDLPAPLRGRALERLALFADAYGLSARDRARLPDAALAAHAWCYDVVRHAVGGGHEAFGRMWRQGGAQRAERTRRWLVAHRDELRAALGVQTAARGRPPAHGS